jgi:transcriptional regulator with XRE-family HTH domain
MHMAGRHPNASDKALANRLRVLREDRGISQETLAGLVGIACQQVQKYEASKDRITFGRLCELADALEMPVMEILAPMFDATGEIVAQPKTTRLEREMLGSFRKVTAQEQRQLITMARSLARRQ